VRWWIAREMFKAEHAPDLDVAATAFYRVEAET
jgi:hypothetical protein